MLIYHTKNRFPAPPVESHKYQRLFIFLSFPLKLDDNFRFCCVCVSVQLRFDRWCLLRSFVVEFYFQHQRFIIIIFTTNKPKKQQQLTHTHRNLQLRKQNDNKNNNNSGNEKRKRNESRVTKRVLSTHDSMKMSGAYPYTPLFIRLFRVIGAFIIYSVCLAVLL